MVIENLEAIDFGQLMICMWRMLALFLCLIHSIIGEQIQDLQVPVCVKENSICIPQNYSKLDLPNKDLTTIILGIDIKDIPKIADKVKNLLRVFQNSFLIAYKNIGKG